ncbi:MAG: beta-lactamase family protein [Cyclobacteriaceae bacterium]|nr:beta-lactamase family protein [Cyclobacteriaceae bacterium]
MRIILFFLFFGATLNSSAQGNDATFALTKGDQIEDLMIRYNELGKFNGSILIVSKGELVYENTLGFANFESREPLDTEMPFYLASLAKQFTAMGIMMLVEEHKISYDDKLSRFFPTIPSIYKNITVHQLLTHTSGVKDYFRLGILNPGLRNVDVYKALFDVKKLDFEPGFKFRYSNSGYVLLALIIQTASGEFYENFIKARIFEPLGMSHSFVYTERNIVPIAVRGYTSKLKPNDYSLYTYGDGGVFSTASDLLKWHYALQNNMLISSESLLEAYTPVELRDGQKWRYGYGWEIGDNLYGKLVFHSGGLAGYRTYIERQLGSSNVIILLTNTSNQHILEIRNKLVKILDERPFTMPEN